MKACSKCKIEKPFEAFSKHIKTRDGYRCHCKECVKKRYLELKKSPLMQLEKQIRSSILLENKLLFKEGKKLCSRCNGIFLIDDLKRERYCEKCKLEFDKEHYEKNKDKCKEYKKEYWEEYKDKNRDKINKKNKEYRENNKEYYKEYRLKKKLEKENQTDVTS